MSTKNRKHSASSRPRMLRKQAEAREAERQLLEAVARNPLKLSDLGLTAQQVHDLTEALSKPGGVRSTYELWRASQAGWKVRV
jgi:hypothetical protein